ncbi:MAG: FAD:protein FMN transferase [Betaproteobacteria bacterium]
MTSIAPPLSRPAPSRRVLVPAVVHAAPPPLGGVVHDVGGRTMGTTWQVRLVGGAQLERDAVAAAIEATLDDVVAQMSTWEPGSDLCRFNRAPAGAWRALPAPFFEVLAAGLEVARASGGAFDPTAGALVDAWGFGPVARGAARPDADVLAHASRRGGWQRLALDDARRAARQPGGLALDLSAIAKGYAVDRVAARLGAMGFASHLVEVGGELRGTGVKPDGQPWWVLLEHPDAEAGDTQTVLALHGLSVASSGDYRRWFEHGGERFSHTIDPRDGLPIRHGLAAVTVVHAECMLADAWSTALGVLGAVVGLALADRLGLAALFVVRRDGGFEEHVSAAFDALLQ